MNGQENGNVPLEERLRALLEQGSRADWLALARIKELEAQLASLKVFSNENSLSDVVEVNSYVVLQKGKYFVNFDITILPKGILEIEPGTEIYFTRCYGIMCYGTLKAVGNENEKIRFTSLNTHWSNIAIAGELANSSVLRNCEISKGAGRAIIPNIDCFNQRVFITSAYRFNLNCQYNFFPIGGGVLVFESAPKIQDCEFRRNNAGSGGGIYVSEDSAAEITGCTFIDNYALVGDVISLHSTRARLEGNILDIHGERYHNPIQPPDSEEGKESFLVYNAFHPREMMDVLKGSFTCKKGAKRDLPRFDDLKESLRQRCDLPVNIGPGYIKIT